MRRYHCTPELAFLAGRCAAIRDERIASARRSDNPAMRAMLASQAKEWNARMIRRLQGKYE